MSDVPTVGEWYAGLPRWRQTLFNVLCRVVGDGIAVEIGGYRKFIRSLDR